MILALDRMESFKELPGEKFQKPSFEINSYFDNVIGVTKMPTQKSQLIVLQIVKEHAPYVITKPLHHSQKILKENGEGMIFSIQVIWNFELEREILGFGEQIKVLSPLRLAGKMQSRMKQTLQKYQGD